jgi:hypothetical protein
MYIVATTIAKLHPTIKLAILIIITEVTLPFKDIRSRLEQLRLLAKAS